MNLKKAQKGLWDRRAIPHQKYVPVTLKQQNYEEDNIMATVHPPQMKIMSLPPVWPKP